MANQPQPIPEQPPPERRKRPRFYRCVGCGACVVAIARPTRCERCPRSEFDDVR